MILAIIDGALKGIEANDYKWLNLSEVKDFQIGDATYTVAYSKAPAYEWCSLLDANGKPTLYGNLKIFRFANNKLVELTSHDVFNIVQHTRKTMQKDVVLKTLVPCDTIIL